MSSSSSSSSGGIGFTGLLTVLFVGLKLTGHITWSWWWVLSPIWISLSLAIVILTIFDRINVRRLFISLESSIEAAVRDQLFEFNDSITRSNFVNIVEPYLRDVQAKRGITDFIVICDETNNTPDVIDSNEFRADIFVKPARSINFIGLTFVATRTGVSFEEVVGRV